jgi:hypothetical protein
VRRDGVWPHFGTFCARAQNESTALMHAANGGHADCARLLLDAGADKEAKDVVCCVCVAYGPSAWGNGDDGSIFLR